MDLFSLLSFEAFASIILAIFGFLLFLQWQQNKQYPAGPWGLPIVGYLPFLRPKAHETLLRLGQKYGNVFSIRCGKYVAVVLNDWEAVNAALVEQSDNFSARPPMFVFDTAIQKKDIVNNDGHLWKEQRQFMIQTLRPFTTKKSIRDSIAREAVDKLIDILEKFDGKTLELENYFFLTLLNIAWRMVSGRVFSESDEKCRELSGLIKQNFEGLQSDSPLNFLPWLRFVVPGGCGYWKFLKNSRLTDSYIRYEIHDHLKNYKEGECNDFIDAYIAEIKRREQKNGTQEPPYNMDHLVGSIYDLLHGGLETSFNTLSWGFLYLTLWPHNQRKIQAEMDEVIGRNRLPCFEDRLKLPYLEAFIMETHRFATVVHLSLPHSNHKSTVILGHSIPKGTMIIQNIYGVHRDPKVWDNPNEFRPERFFNTNNEIIKPKYLMPFSIGGRICPGEPVAQMQLFMIFSSLLHKFSFELPPNIPKPSLECIVRLTLSPKPYSILIRSR